MLYSLDGEFNYFYSNRLSMELIRGVILSNFKKDNNALKADKQKTEEILNPLNPAEDKDKRTGIERRKFTYSLHLPDKRSGIDRRGKLSKISR